MKRTCFFYLLLPIAVLKVPRQQSTRRLFPTVPCVKVNNRVRAFFFLCDTPGTSSHPHPEGGPCMSQYHTLLFCTWATFPLPAAGSFSCSRPRCTLEGRVTMRRKFGPRSISVERALNIQSRNQSKAITEWPCVLPPPPNTLGIRIFVFMNCCTCITPPFELFTCGSHSITAAALQPLAFGPVTKGASLCVGVCVPLYVSASVFACVPR